jgi:hypothetical protein
MADTCSFGAPFRITLCALALATIMMATCSLTRDTPLNIEDDASEQQILLDQNAWNSPEAGIAAVLLQKKGSLKSLKIKAKSLSKKSATSKKGRTTKKTTKSKKKQGKKQATKKKVPKTAVQKALQAAANAKIEAMAQQRKALQAASKAKEAAAKAANAPMNKRGHEIVKRAQNTARDSALAVDAAKASVRALAKAKAKASKAILDAAGGKYSKDTGFQGQGGYFGAALKTAFHNGQLTERLKYRDWKKKTVMASAKQAFKKGEKEGFSKGFKKGEKRGEKKELPKAVKKAQKVLLSKAKAQRKAKALKKKSKQKAALKAAAKKEASKVRKKVLRAAKRKKPSAAVVEFFDDENEDAFVADTEEGLDSD